MSHHALRWIMVLSFAVVTASGCAAGGERRRDGGPPGDLGTTDLASTDSASIDGGDEDAGPCVDEDVDGVCDTVDVCLGHDDALDTDLDGTPDGCDCDQSSGTCSPFAACASGSDGVDCTCSPGYAGDGETCTAVECGALSDPTDGTVTLGGTPPAVTATYACSVGFNLVGAAVRTCQVDGSWSGAAPVCVVVDCGALAVLSNGTVSAPSTTAGSLAAYACNAGYRLVGDASRTCQTDGSWSGAAPICALIDCGALSAPGNGAVSAPSTVAGAVAVYSCNAGHLLVGAASRTCGDDGAWSGSAPTCAPVDCGALSTPSNGSVSAPTTTLGATATYSCNTGYLISGGATRACQTDGTWSGAAPTCAPVSCGAVAAPANGTVSAPTTTYGATATYGCNAGYTMSGAGARTCQASGTWSGSAPTCIAVGCGAIGAPANGTVSAPTSTAGSVATFSCSSGYRLARGQYSRCDGTIWRGAIPECRPVLSCGGCGGAYAAGDRVRAAVASPSGAGGVALGTMGTVIASQATGTGLEVLIQWDGWAGGHDGNCAVATCGSCTASPTNNRWWTACNQIQSTRIACACGGVYSDGDRVMATIASPSGAAGVPLGRMGTTLGGSTTTGALEMQMQWDAWTGGHTGNCAAATCGACVDSATANRWWTECTQFGRP